MGKLSTAVGRRRKIKDVDFLYAVRRAREIRADGSGASRWDVASILGGMEEQVVANARDPLAPYTRQIEGIDPKQVLATARRLIKRGELAGCDCGCPGWFTAVDDVLAPPARTERGLATGA